MYIILNVDKTITDLNEMTKNNEKCILVAYVNIYIH